MRKKDIEKDDVLRNYINPGKRMEAPEGFSSKVMSHIYMETKPVKVEKNFLIPLIFAGVFLVLAIATVLFVPASSMVIPKFSLPVSFNFSFPELDSMTGIPPLIIYIVAAAIAIVVLDSALGIMFRKERK